MKAVCLFTSVAFLLIAAAGAEAQSVAVDYDKNADFSGFKTYAWARGTQARNPLIDRRIIEGVDSQLAAKGLQRVDGSGDPDLVVVYHAAANTQLQINTAKLGGWGPGWGWGYGDATIMQVQEIPMGELAVDIAELKDKKFIWSGTATGTISDRPDKVQKMLNKTLDKMFKKFPPPQKR